MATRREIYNDPDTDEFVIQTLSFSHPSFDKVFYFVNDVDDWEFELTHKHPQIFTALPFVIGFPKRDNLASKELDIILCNIGRELVPQLEKAVGNTTVPITVTYREYYDRRESLPISNPIVMTAHDIGVTNTAVQLKAVKFDMLNRPFPDRIYTDAEFPALI